MKIIFLFAFFLLMIHFAFGQIDTINAQTTIQPGSANVIGKYKIKEKIHFEDKATCKDKLWLKDNHEYVYKFHCDKWKGEKKSYEEEGTWMLDGDILTLQPYKSANDKEQHEPEKFKIVNGDLWYLSPDKLFLKKVK